MGLSAYFGCFRLAPSVPVAVALRLQLIFFGDHILHTFASAEIFSSTISSGYAHTCAVIYGGELKCWGRNSFGVLGTGDSRDYGGSPQSLPLVSLPTVRLGEYAVQEVAASSNEHACALSDGSVKCWGGNSKGQLGLEDTISRGEEATDLGNALEVVNLGVGAVQVCVGQEHSCALLKDLTVKCW